MDIDKYVTYQTDDFILDEYFLDWVIRPDFESDRFWGGFLENHPEKREPVREAALLIKGIQPVEEELPSGSLDNLLARIYDGSRKEKKRLLYVVLRVAAILVVCLGALSLVLLKVQQRSPFPLAASEPVNSGTGKVILSDGTSYEFKTRETVIQQSSGGSLVVNKDTVALQDRNKRNGSPEMNQVVIPYGSHSEVTLADGSRVWLNSGSRLSYPVEFQEKERIVFLAGEAFFDVKPDPQKPFLVKTRDVIISVLGTRFDISAYEEDENVQTVLLSGRVSIRSNSLLSRADEINPGQRMTYNRDLEKFSKDEVDPQYTTAWIHGYLIFENEPTPLVFKKLERYYNKPIRVDEGLSSITFSGKLDLRDNIGDVLDNIAFASAVSIDWDGQCYRVKTLNQNR